MEESVLFTFPFRTYGNHASELSTHDREDQNGLGMVHSISLRL